MAVDIVREPGIPDFGQMIDLIRLEWPEEWADTPDAEKVRWFADSYDRDRDTVVYLFDGVRRIGFYRYTVWPRDSACPDKLHIMDIVLLPGYRGRGLGKRMLREIIADAKAQGRKSILSRTLFSNTVSAGLHSSFGFTEAFRTEDSIVWEYEILPDNGRCKNG